MSEKRKIVVFIDKSAKSVEKEIADEAYSWEEYPGGITGTIKQEVGMSNPYEAAIIHLKSKAGTDKFLINRYTDDADHPNAFRLPYYKKDLLEAENAIRLLEAAGKVNRDRALRVQNMNIIIAAPDLLEACQTVLPFLRDLVNRPRSSASAQRIGADAEDSLLVIEDAIAKAEGRE